MVETVDSGRPPLPSWPGDAGGEELKTVDEGPSQRLPDLVTVDEGPWRVAETEGYYAWEGPVPAGGGFAEIYAAMEHTGAFVGRRRRRAPAPMQERAVGGIVVDEVDVEEVETKRGLLVAWMWWKRWTWKR